MRSGDRDAADRLLSLLFARLHELARICRRQPATRVATSLGE
jgi:hypothetical protein